MGGEIVGVAPRFFDEPGILFQGCTQMHFTDTMRQRKELMEQLSDGFIMAPGGIGTFEEFFEILTLRQLGRHQKPIAILNVRGYYDPLLALLENAARYLKRNGILLYSTCTILRRENEDVAAQFLAGHPDFSMEESRTLWPHIDGTDGFFLCKLRKGGSAQ